MESSSAPGQSDKKRSKIALRTKIFATAIRAVQVQTTPSPLVESHIKRGKQSGVVSGDCFQRVAESKSETDVALSRGSSSWDQIAESQSDNQLAKIFCTGESEHRAQEKAESCSGPIANQLFKKGGDCHLADSCFEEVETVRDESDAVLGNVKSVSEHRDGSQERGKVPDSSQFNEEDSGVVDPFFERVEKVLVQSESLLDKAGTVFHQLDQGGCELGKVKGPNDQALQSSVCDQPTVPENTEPVVRSVDQEHVERKKADADRSLESKDLSRNPRYVRSVRSANHDYSIGHGETLNHGEVDPQDKDCRSFDRGKGEQRMRDRRSSDSGKVERQNKDRQSPECGKPVRNFKGYKLSDRAKREQQLKVYSSYPIIVEEQREGYRSSDRKKTEHQTKGYQSSYHRNPEPQNRDSRETVEADGSKSSLSGSPGRYSTAVRAEPQEREFRDHRGRGRQGSDILRRGRRGSYHYNRIRSDSDRLSQESWNSDYRQDGDRRTAEKPRKSWKENLDGSLKRNDDEVFVTGSDDVTERNDLSKTRTRSNTSAFRGRRSRRGAGALGMGYNSYLGSRESMRSERSNVAGAERLAVEYRGRGNSARKPAYSDGRRSPEHRFPRKFEEHKTDKKSDYYRAEFPNKDHKARNNSSDSSSAQGCLVYNRGGRRGKTFRGRGYSTRGMELFSGQSGRGTSDDDGSQRNSTAVDENQRAAESQRSRASGRRILGRAPGRYVVANVAPERSTGVVSARLSKEDSSDDCVRDKEVKCVYNSRNRPKDYERSKPLYVRPVLGGGGEEKLGTRVDGARRHSDTAERPAEVAKRADAAGYGNDRLLSSRLDGLHVSRAEFANALSRDGVDGDDDVDSVCSIFAALDTSSISPSPTSSAMNVRPLRQLSEAQGASSAANPLPTDGRGSLTTPVPGGFWSQEAQNLNSQGLVMELMSVRNPPPQHRSQCESSLEKSFHSQNHGFHGQYSDAGQMQLPYDMSSPSCSSPSAWNNQPPAGPLFGIPSNTAGLRQSVRPILGISPSGPNPQASQGYGSGRFLHTPSAAIYHPPEPTSPTPDPSSLLRAAFQSANNRLEYKQFTPPRFSFQTPVAAPSAAPTSDNCNLHQATTPTPDNWYLPPPSTPTAANWNLPPPTTPTAANWNLPPPTTPTAANWNLPPPTTPTAANWNLPPPTAGSNCGYGGDKPPSQPDNGRAPAPQEVPQVSLSLNISRDDYQHWMDCYIKARDTEDDASIAWCRHYWYVAVYLPSVAPPADVLSSPDPRHLLDMGASADLSQMGTPLENSGHQSTAESGAKSMSCSEWQPLVQEASVDSAKGGSCPHHAFSGMSAKNWKSSGGAEDRMRTKCKRLLYGDFDATDVTPPEAPVSPAKGGKKFKIERAAEQQSFHNSQKFRSFHMKSPRFQGSSENQLQIKGRNSEGRGKVTGHPKFNVTRRSLGSVMSAASATPETLVVQEWMDWKAQFQQLTKDATVPYIDSHCHLDLLYRRANFQGTFKDFRSLHTETFPGNYFGCVAIFCNPVSWASYLLEDSLFNSLLSEENIWASVGCHPKNATDFTPRTEMNLRQLLRHERVKALGEVGLDYSGSFSQHRDVQIDVLQRQVATAVKLNKPLVIHARDAESEIGEVLEKLVPKDYKIHRHCFLGSWSEAEAWLEKFPQSYIGLTPGVTFAKPYSALRDLMWNLPLSKLLLETDAPYFIPAQIPVSEMSLSHPGLAITVAIEVANVKHIPVNDVLSACLRNTRDMYDL